MSADRGGISDGRNFCRSAVKYAKRDFGRIDILVNNAAEQHLTEEYHEDQGEPASTVQPTIPQNRERFAMVFLGPRGLLDKIQRAPGRGIEVVTASFAFHESSVGTNFGIALTCIVLILFVLGRLFGSWPFFAARTACSISSE